MMPKGGTMDQIKIGSFIADCRKKQGLTQMQLAEKLNITDRAVSKWENGRSLPDSSIMLELCRILGISVNDLLNGEVVTVDNYNEKSEELLLKMAEEKEKSDKWLLKMEIVMGFSCVLVFFALTIIAALVQMEDWLRIVLILVGAIPFLVSCPIMLKIEQVAGYYQCAACGHKYVPSYKAVLNAMHMGRTRYMKCPKCGKKTWQKKVINKK